ncbi:MAG: ribosome biogenesis factor YjgA [Gammaproteobacteria bacterium]|nr:ribosome biogenesis factor YjgA [Gammaproteobacteria bacterium]
MSRKSRKGYYVEGEFIAAGSDLDRQFRVEQKGTDEPSRTELKNASETLQKLGEQLLTLRADLFEGLPLPEKLRDAILEAGRISNFEARRRQKQFIGKLMHRLDARALEAVEVALRFQHGQSARETLTLHRAEKWRDDLIADDGKVGEWMQEFPATDAQQMRALIRQARKDASEDRPGETVRHGRAYREIFALVRDKLGSSGDNPR